MFKDYYKILGLTPLASQREIKEAFQQLQKEMSKKPWLIDWQAQQDREEAYLVLSHQKRRWIYDTWRRIILAKISDGLDWGKMQTLEKQSKTREKPTDFAEGLGLELEVTAEQLAEVFKKLVTALDFEKLPPELTEFNQWLKRLNQDQIISGLNLTESELNLRKKENVIIKLSLSAEALKRGRYQLVSYRVKVLCADCRGQGSKGGAPLISCAVCQKENRLLGQCLVCQGLGKYPQENCRRCQGEGRVLVRKTGKIKIPANLAAPAWLRIKEKGHYGFRGASQGDLIVKVVKCKTA